MVNKIKFKNFKIFKDWQTLELRPLTILIGKNNSGKSAVAKLPTLLSGSLSGTFSTPLKPENERIKLGLSYEDLVYNRYPADSLGFEISTETETINVSLYGDRSGKVHFSEFSYNKEKKFDLSTTKFKGFVPNKKLFKTLNLEFDYIGPFRKIPSPYFQNSVHEFDKIGIEGENAYPILIQNNEEEMFNKISNWYKINFEGWGLKVSPISGLVQTYEISLENIGLKPINIVNVGQGIHQVLPLIVRSYMPTDKETLIIIEEPETHLHPAAHGNLAQRFAESYLEDNNKSYLLETHSQNFVLRMRRLVAEKVIKKEDLAIYYVDFDKDKKESSLKFIEIDENGGIPNNDWPTGVFNETSLETRAIYNAQLNDKQNVDRD